MALDSTLIHGLVAKAKDILGGLAVTVTHKAFVSTDGYGKARYAATGVSIDGFLSREQRRVVTMDGREVASSFNLVIPRNYAIAMQDRITLPDGTSPPILALKASLDDTGAPYAVEVYF
jgi:hypothetical protein